MTDQEHCWRHKEYKKGCPDCFKLNDTRPHKPDCQCDSCDPDKGDVSVWGYDGEAL